MMLLRHRSCGGSCGIKAAVAVVLCSMVIMTTSTVEASSAFVHRSSTAATRNSMRPTASSSLTSSSLSSSSSTRRTARSFFPIHQFQQPRVSSSSSSSSSIVLSASSHDRQDLEDEKDVVEEWHPHDPAFTTPQLLAGIWFQIAQAKSMVKGESMTVIYPSMQAQLKENPQFFHRLMAHFDSCKDVCDHFGITTTLQPYIGPKSKRIEGFTVTSHRDPNKDPDANYFDFKYDPFWNEEEDDALFQMYENIDERIEEDESASSSSSTSSSSTRTSSSSTKDPYPEIVNKIPDDDEEIFKVTKVWVNKLMSDLGICPFTSGPDRAGLPLGNVYYCIDRSTTMEDVYARYWKEVVRVEQQPERDLATTLLILPEFCMDNIDLFESFLNTLTQPLAALGVEDLLQLVFFHPHYVFRDGAQRSGKNAGAANYARRSPWPMINLLRTTQVRTAQKGIPTGLVYTQNEKTLTSIGTDALETMLRLRNWDDIADLKVNRRDMEALRVAQDFQLTGQVSAKDQNVQDDATPAVNKVAKEQVEQGNLVNVMLQALEKRLGNGVSEGGAVTPASITQLSGPETSATVMASDFVLNELDRVIASAAQIQALRPVVVGSTTGAVVPPHRSSREEEAHRMLLEDLYGAEHTPVGDDRIGGDSEWRILMGQGGILQDSDSGSSEEYSAGMNPSNFY